MSFKDSTLESNDLDVEIDKEAKLLAEIKLAENEELLEQERKKADQIAQHERLQKILNEPAPDRVKQEKVFNELQNMSDEDAAKMMAMYFKELSDQWESGEERNMFVEVVNSLAPLAHKYTGKRVRGLVALHTIVGFYQTALEYPDVLAYFDHCLQRHAEELDNMHTLTSNESTLTSNESKKKKSKVNNLEELD